MSTSAAAGPSIRYPPGLEGECARGRAAPDTGRPPGLPPEAQIIWVSTRRAEPAADTIAGNVRERYVLNDVLVNMTAPLDELSTAHLVVLEAPPIVTARFEHTFLSLVQRIRASGPHVSTIVQPSLRRKSNKTLWVHRWNRLRNAPFKFRQTCTCQTGNAVPGCHMTLLIGSTLPHDVSPCAEVPTLSTTS